MTLKEIKLANPGFFSDKCANFFGDDRMVIAKEGGKSVLRIFSAFGTAPVYLIDPVSKQLTYLRHDCEASHGPA